MLIFELFLVLALIACFVGGWYAHRKFETVQKMWTAFKALFDRSAKSNSQLEVTMNGSGIGVLGLLGVVFVVLKLVGTITWSWWLVTLPFWGGIALGVVIFLAILLFKLLFD